MIFRPHASFTRTCRSLSKWSRDLGEPAWTQVIVLTRQTCRKSKKRKEQECKEKSQIRSEFLLITSNKQEYRTKQKNILQLDQVKAGKFEFSWAEKLHDVLEPNTHENMMEPSH